MYNRSQFCHLFLELQKLSSRDGFDTSQFDRLMDSFDNKFQRSVSLWDLSIDNTVLLCIRAMMELVSTRVPRSKKRDEQAAMLTSWKTAMNNSALKDRRPAPGSVFLPALLSLEIYGTGSGMITR
jgi:hypothetical protein